MESKEYFIYRIEKDGESLCIYLTQTHSSWASTAWINDGLTKIQILKHDCQSSIEELKVELDSYEDGITFEITEDDSGMCLTTSDVCGFTKCITGSKITIIKVPFSNDDLAKEIEAYKAKINELEKRNVYLQGILNIMDKVADKEIIGTEQVLNQVSDINNEKYLKWNIKRQIWLEVKQKLSNCN